MQVTAAFCKEQEAIQRAKAASEPLENRRKIALDAAKAWAAEAILAKKRETSHQSLDALDAAITAEFKAEAANSQSD